MDLKRLGVGAAVLFAALMFTAAPAQADPIDLELALLIDSSGSIGSSGFALQKNAYVSSLNDLKTNGTLKLDGSVAIGVWQFSNTISQEFATTILDSEADFNDLITALNGMSWIGSTTNISGAINVASADLNNSNGIESLRQLIDISTDGEQVGGAGSPATAAANALTNGIDQVNGIFIGTGIDDSWVPAGSNKWYADSFEDFETSIYAKLAVEIDPVPEPGSLALLGLGLVGLGYASRRRRKALAS